MALPADLSITPDLDPENPDNYDGVPGEWCDCHVCTLELDDEYIDDHPEDFAL